MLGYKYQDKYPNRPIYKFVSKENIINGKDDIKKAYIQTRCPIKRFLIKPVVMITFNGFFELATKSNMPNSAVYRHWINNILSDLTYRYINIESINGNNIRR